MRCFASVRLIALTRSSPWMLPHMGAFFTYTPIIARDYDLDNPLFRIMAEGGHGLGTVSTEETGAEFQELSNIQNRAASA
jgi:hypothetical protein